MRNRKIVGRKRKTRTKEDWTHRHKSEADRFRTVREIKTEMQVEHGERISSSTTIEGSEAGLNGCSLDKPWICKLDRETR